MVSAAIALRSAPSEAPRSSRRVGRYELYDEIAAGGMATVHFGRLLGPAGFSRTVAIKRLHPQYAKDPEFVCMFLDEARLASRIRHPHVASTLDVVTRRGELFVVMEFVLGDSVSRLARIGKADHQEVPLRILSSICVQGLLGLDAAHQATNEQGQALQLVHRDVSPQNLLVGLDGMTRIVDFGIAKAVSRLQTTSEGQVKGKLAYMSPEQLRMDAVDARTDVFAMGIVLWELLTGRRLFQAPDPAVCIARILQGSPQLPSLYRGSLPQGLDELVSKALALKPGDRFQTAREMAIALEKCVPPAGAVEVEAWVRASGGPGLEQRERQLAAIEGRSALQSVPVERHVESNSSFPHAGRRDSLTVPTVRAAPVPQGETVSAATAAASPRGWANLRRRKALLLGALIFGTGCTLALVSALAQTRGERPQERPVKAEPPALSRSSGTAAPSLPAAVDAPMPETVAAPAAAPPAPNPPAPVRRPTKGVPGATTRAASSPKAPNCNPPYITQNGVRRFKLECVK